MAFPINVDDMITWLFYGFSNRATSAQPKTGRVILLFQPAEEDEWCAKVFSDTKFAAFNPDYVFALHNLPGYPKNQIIVKK
jgi:metal-dependent amidase/aminoacylase/carboxypeptidase family protein